ncbi:PAS domain S-box protein, partial [Planktothrix sp. FACHB-1355]|uniref:hybrid sensor histidine kinase/response regulator n=1 Tax=Planktothrix sp. FACHB-1355 TaxID=2692854 RepID=UPI00168A4031
MNGYPNEKGIILIVDDTPTNLGVLFDLLADSGFKVLVAQDGESAIQKVEYARPDLILLDVLMPGIDGFETCCRLKASQSTKDIPVIFMTALTETVDKVKGLRLGAVDYITKPFQHEEVLARVTTHLSICDLTKKLQEKNLRLQEEIQERALAEEALRQSEKRFRTIVDTAQEGIWLLDAQANTIYVNQRISEMLGYTIEEILGRSWFDFMDNLARIEAVQKFERRLQEINQRHDLRFLRKDGSEIWTIVSSSPMGINNGEFIGAINMLTDITERKLSEQKIREQAALLDITKDAVIVRDLQNKILFWNKGAEQIYGWTQEKVIGKDVHEILDKETSPQIIEIQNIFAQKGEWHGELNQVTKGGHDIIVESCWTLVRDDKQQPKSVLVVNTNITEKKQFEKQFLRAQRMESLGTLAGGIAHDFNNVLTPIMMAIQLLQIKIKDKQGQEWLNTLEINVKRAADLVKQVLSFARGCEGKRTLMEVTHLLLETEQIIKNTFPKSIEVNVNISPELWCVAGDPTQLHQVLVNLCVNARDAMPEGGTLTISAENIFIDENFARMNIEAKVGSYIAIAVSDTGFGISNKILERIFDPFFTTKDLGKGSGLGLATVSGIVKGHGGFIEVFSEVKKGTKFNVYLPATDTTIKDFTKEKQRRSQVPVGHGEVVLVVDDEDAIREITKISLESHHYKVMSACDGIEAIALYAQHKEEIDIVLVDMMMPSMDGSTTIRTLQKINPQVKILAVSGLLPNHQITAILGNSVKIF